jgi:hypothetical protein
MYGADVSPLNMDYHWCDHMRVEGTRDGQAESKGLGQGGEWI